MTAPARVAAHRALRSVNGRRADLATALARTRTDLEDDRDQALAAEIVTGTLRWQAFLDWVIDRRLDRSPGKLDATLRDILRAAVYQLWRLERVPAHAVVSDAVTLTREAGLPRAAGLVNAVLRRIAPERHDLSGPGHPGVRPSGQVAADLAAWRGRALDYLAITWSHPRWLVARWLDRFGLDVTEAWVRFNNAPAPLTLRANGIRLTRDSLARRLADVGVSVEPTTYAPDGLIVTDGNPLRTSLAGEGLFLVQDEASQLVPLAVVPAGVSRVLDACAAPGGKTTALAASLAPGALVVAADVRPRRVALLYRTVAACGARNVRIVAADLARGLPFGAVFDAVVVDAPCSGFGTVRRDPDIKWHRHEADLATLAATQLTLLQQAATAVRPGGWLLYATCSSEPDENRQVVARFLAACPAFATLQLPLAGSALPRAVINADGALETSPHEHGLEAFFAAMLVRRR
jgi:16S rRNA (cytosine967-C5)-methyltransferase